MIDTVCRGNRAKAAFSNAERAVELPLAAVRSGRSDLLVLAPRKADCADLETAKSSFSIGAALPELPAFSKAVGRTNRN
jgi:hypothetical protein